VKQASSNPTGKAWRMAIGLEADWLSQNGSTDGRNGRAVQWWTPRSHFNSIGIAASATDTSQASPPKGANAVTTTATVGALAHDRLNQVP